MEKNEPKPAGWSCPDCGRRFARRDQKHIHGRWTVENHLENKSARVLDMYKRFVQLVGDCGPFEYAPVKSQIGFRVNRIFAGVKLAERSLDGYLDIARAIRSPRFYRVTPYQRNLFVHHFGVRVLDELDAKFARWIRESYTVGEGRHLR